MRSFAFLFALSLQAQTLKLAPPEPQVLEKVKQLAPHENLSCTQVESQANSRAITIEFLDPSTPRHGTPSSLETSSLFQDVFAASSSTGFEFDHWGTLRGKKLAVYRYSNQLNGKTHAGLLYADENTGAISRITFRAETNAHLFCTAQSR